ncbi:MAG: MarC family protein [Brevirhabdus sp.]
MDPTLFISAFATLFVIIDPIGLTPLFAALTQGMSARERLGVAIRASVIAAGILTLFGLLGEQVLGFVGISMPAFRIAGGILLFLTALDMLFERRTPRREQHSPNREDPSAFPLGIPLIAGPGSIATMILLVGEAGNDWGQIALIHLVMVAVIGTAFLLFQTAGLLDRALGKTGINVVTRLLGMLLAALSVQFVVDGVRAVLPIA